MFMRASQRVDAVAKMISLLVSQRNQRIIGLVLGLFVFAFLLAVASSLAVYQINQAILRESLAPLQQFTRLRETVDATFSDLQAELTAPACSPQFREQMRRVAFRNEGFSEFLFAPGGIVQCSGVVDFAGHPVALGKPDLLPAKPGGTSLWIDRGLGFVGLPGLVGTIGMRDPFAIVVPPQRISASVPSWLEMEIVLVSPDGRIWHRSGEAGLFERHQIADGPRASLFDLTFRQKTCAGHHCVVMEAAPLALLSAGWAYFILALGGAALLAAWLGLRGQAMVKRTWSFEARFVRHLGPESIVCAYQPIMELATGRIAGCEVLARWRDVDGTLVAPDRFIPLLEKNGLTVRLTQLVVDRAFAELIRLPTQDAPLFVSFNIFPQDLDAAVLGPIFDAFAGVADRFDVVLELVESDAVVAETAQREIEALRARGIRTFIDDFGTGYSNIENLAALSVDGVKLDRAFAMAPDDGMMAQMLVHAIGMIHIAGRAIVVEGVESEERLTGLRAIVPPIDYVQGYHISRPLDIDRLAAFLAARDLRPVDLAA